MKVCKQGDRWADEFLQAAGTIFSRVEVEAAQDQNLQAAGIAYKKPPRRGIPETPSKCQGMITYDRNEQILQLQDPLGYPKNLQTVGFWSLVVGRWEREKKGARAGDIRF